MSDAEKEKKQMERDKNIPYVDLRNGARGIVIWAQMDGDSLADSALEILGEARRVTKKLDEDSRNVIAVIIGKNSSKHAQTLIHHGADRVYVIEDDRLFEYMTIPFTKAMIAAIKEINPEIAIYSASTLGRDLAPRIAAILNLGLSADCTEFDVGYYANRRKNQRFAKVFKMIRPSFGESKLATIIGPWSYPQSATARPGVFPALSADTSRTGEIINFDPGWENSDFAVQILETVRSVASLELNKADIIISGGFGVGKEGFSMLLELVEALRNNGQKAELGSSRAAVDAGFIEYKHQIGQTGKTVRPSIYIAVGISGAIQHIAGMKDSKTVIAVNFDPTAKIFAHSNYGIVADYREVIPEMIDRVNVGYMFPID